MLENIKVGSKTNQNALAGAIASAIRTNGITTLSAVGQNAAFQAIKGLTLARRFLAEEKIDLIVRINMEDNKVEGSEDDSNIPHVIVKFDVSSQKLED